MSLKIGSFNVMTLNEKSKRFNNISKLIHDQNFDIIGLQEITYPALINLAKILNMNYYYTREGYQGNGILSNYKFHEKKSIRLGVDVPGRKILPRYLMTVTVETPLGTINFGNTHLDHKYEDIRFQQYQIMKPYLEGLDFLTGDFNTQYFGDYTPEELEVIHTSRKKSNLEKADDKTIRSLQGDGFVIEPYIGPTCPYMTRVDFVLHKNNKKWNTKSEMIDCIGNYDSDHNLVIMECHTK